MSLELVKMGYTIATIDLETLALCLNTAVYDMGVVFTNVLPKPGVLWNLSDVAALQALDQNETNGVTFKAMRMHLNVMEQVLDGRTVDQNTVNFHKGLYAKRGVDFTASFMDDQMEKAKSMATARLDLRTQFERYKPSELWVNHTSFDIPRIVTVLYGTESVNALPWHFQKEFDIATAKLMFRKMHPMCVPDPLKFDISKADNRHDSIADCLYNLSALSVCLNYGSPSPEVVTV